MSALSQFLPGYYGNATRDGIPNMDAGLSVVGDGRGCDAVSGWFVVDRVMYDGSTLKAIDVRFEQHCEGVSAALHGQIHWNADDPTMPPGPVDPPPANLWSPAQGSTPTTGDYIYLIGDSGDYIIGAQTLTYPDANSTLSVSASGDHLSVDVSGTANWTGEFITMISLSEFATGYYGGLARYPFHNPAKGGLDWSGNGRGCGTLKGWFVVDLAMYENATLKAIDLRFEQHCEGGSAALRGKLHYVAP
jgi:hypothetical protein